MTACGSGHVGAAGQASHDFLAVSSASTAAKVATRLIPLGLAGPPTAITRRHCIAEANLAICSGARALVVGSQRAGAKVGLDRR